MKVLGVVRWTNTDKGGHPIAGVQPLFDVGPSDWRKIDASAEFPTQGQVFWPLARDATENALFFFRVEENPGQKDEFKLVEPQAAVEVLDLRELGAAAEVRAALAAGLRRPNVGGGKVFVWCDPDLLVGPIKLTRGATGALTFELAPRDRVPTFKASPAHMRAVKDRMVRTDGGLGAPLGYVDWDDDPLVLRRALTAAVDRARRSGADPGLTTALIQKASEAIAAGGSSADLQLERYRLERGKALCADGARVAELASEIGAVLLAHPAVASSIDEQRKALRRDLEVQIRAQLASEFSATKAELVELRAKNERVRVETSAARDELERLRQEAERARATALVEAEEAETALDSRVREALAKPAALFAEIALLRALLPDGRGKPSRPPVHATPRIVWSKASSVLNDKLALQRALTAAFKYRGVAPAWALRLHASVSAGLVPVVVGACGVAALAAYAHAVCGGRLCALHVSPGFTQPSDLLGTGTDGDFVPHATGLLAAVGAAESVAAPSVITLEGINRGPTESYLVPFLQLRSADLTIQAPAFDRSPIVLPPCLRIAATAVAGATSVPVTRDLWAHAVAIEVDSAPRTAGALGPATEVALDSDLFTPAEVPGVVSEILEACPMVRDCCSSLERFGAGLARFEADHERLRSALVECVLLPLVATTPAEEERAALLESIARMFPDHDEVARRLGALEQRLRARLG